MRGGDGVLPSHLVRLSRLSESGEQVLLRAQLGGVYFQHLVWEESVGMYTTHNT